MIYTFKVSSKAGDPLETTHHANGVDVIGQAHALMEKHPECDGVEVLLLQTRLFYLQNKAAARRRGAASL